ncbi:MAG: phytoene desaturase [Thermomicrobiales bacterium]
MTHRIVVIGSGFGGLAAGIRLAAAGHDVTIVEKRDKPGGRAYVYAQDGFAFDGGPTVITAPWLITELFELAGRDASQAVTLVPLDPFYRIFFDDGQHFDYAADVDRMREEIRRVSRVPSDIQGYDRFTAATEKIFAKGFTELATTPFLSPMDMVRVAPDLLRLKSYRTVYGLVSSFVKDEKLRQVLSFHPLLVGGNPFQTTSIYALIHHLERTWGIWFAMGGTGAIIRALVELFQDLGGTLMLASEATRITVDGDKASSVQLIDGQLLPADIVVCNAEVARAYQTLVPASAQSWLTRMAIRRMQHSMSLVVIYFGTNREYRSDPGSRLAHHNIILGPRYEGLLDDIFNRKVLSQDFSLYLHMPTLTDPALAPPGGEAFYVLAPVPNLAGNVDWDRAATPYRNLIMEFLEERYLPGLSSHLVTERMIDPRHFRDELNSHLGAGFSIEPILTQSAWFRPHNQSPDVPNLFFVGAGTHPGAGLPGVLSSAKIAADLIGRASG